MDDLITWLRAQIDEDERKNNSKYEMRPGVANILESEHLPGGVQRVRVDGGPPQIMTDQEYVDAFLQPKSDQRLLREVDAKRRIIDLVVGAYAGYAVLPLLALPYSDRPGYREEWKP